MASPDAPPTRQERETRETRETREAREAWLRVAVEATGIGLWEWRIHDNSSSWDAGMLRIFARDCAPAASDSAPGSVSHSSRIVGADGVVCARVGATTTSSVSHAKPRRDAVAL